MNGCAVVNDNYKNVVVVRQSLPDYLYMQEKTLQLREYFASASEIENLEEENDRVVQYRVWAREALGSLRLSVQRFD